jgi:hypothetical protein
MENIKKIYIRNKLGPGSKFFSFVGSSRALFDQNYTHVIYEFFLTLHYNKFDHCITKKLVHTPEFLVHHYKN